MLQPPTSIIWTREKLDAFKAKHATVKSPFFKFENHPFDTEYAKYLIEYLEMKLGKIEKELAA